MDEPRKAKEQFCSICGESLGRFNAYYADLQTCGSPDCDREARDMERGAQEEREERARADDFERY
jgi:hypothetical protein